MSNNDIDLNNEGVFKWFIESTGLINFWNNLVLSYQFRVFSKRFFVSGSVYIVILILLLSVSIKESLANLLSSTGLVFMLLYWILLTIGYLIGLSQNKKFRKNSQENDEYKKCPYCAEEIKFEAKFCKHCHRSLSKLTLLPKFFIIPIMVIFLVIYLVSSVNKKEGIAGVKTIETLSQCSTDKAVQLVKPNVIKIMVDTKQGEVEGSGFIEPSGYLVTNSHVVETKGNITAHFSDGSTSRASLTSNDTNADVAILALEKNQASMALKWGDSANLKELEKLIAIGYPLNIPGEPTTTEGSLSAKRTDSGINYLQISTPINPGNSGGPLINTCGEVVGINTFKAQDAESINFAISSNSARDIISRLISNKKINYINQVATNPNLIQTQPPSSTATSPNSSYKRPIPSCSTISAYPTELEVGKTTSLSFYPILADSITWSGGGNFSNKTSQTTSWSSSSSGEYTLTVKAKNSSGSCSKSIKISVLGPLNRIDGLAAIKPIVLSSKFDTAINKDVIYLNLYYYSQTNSPLSTSRTATMPITASITISTSNYSDTKIRQVYTGSLNNSQIGTSYSNRIITIPLDQLNLTDADYSNKSVRLLADLAINTPEQGSFSSTTSGYIFKP